MKLAEIRDLDGPNLFMLSPAIKVEIALDDGETEQQVAGALVPGATDLLAGASEFIASLYGDHEQPAPDIVKRQMDEPSHTSIAFGWMRRGFALEVARRLFETMRGVVDDNANRNLARLLEVDTPDDRPICISDSERSAIAISVTGTNGKTTTTRLIAHIMRAAGFRTGWNSSSGIYIEGEEIEAGDFSGPSGAQRVLQDPSVQAAVLETARGGILLRGLGYEHNDVSVFTNVSSDHLGLQGVNTLETLADVKAVVCRVTRAHGTAVVNADDALVMAATKDIAAPRLLVSQQADNPVLMQHLASGGQAIVADERAILVRRGDSVVAEYLLDKIPLTYNGRARHMVENAMCAIGGALGAGLGPAQIRAGLRTFRNDAADNPGRMNVYRRNGVTIVLDFAHNEAGITYLTEFGKRERQSPGRLISVIGTAGDRSDASLRSIGRIAAEASAIVIAHGTAKYLRGRTLDELMGLYRSGAEQVPGIDYRESENELTALEEALGLARAGDVIVLMAHEFVPQLAERLASIADEQ